jgi:hypothetical protein
VYLNKNAGFVKLNFLASYENQLFFSPKYVRIVCEKLVLMNIMEIWEQSNRCLDYSNRCLDYSNRCLD